MRFQQKLTWKFNMALRPYFNEDLAILRKANEEKYPFYPAPDEAHLVLGIKWLKTAHEAVGRQGFPNKFNIGGGFGLGPSYPETTGYTLNTLLTLLRHQPLRDFNYLLIVEMIRDSAQYLLKMQLEGGGFTGGHQKIPSFGKPSMFNTGQILLGLADLYESMGEKRISELFPDLDREAIGKSITAAGEFMESHITPEGYFDPAFSYIGKKSTYQTRSAYGLLRTGHVTGRESFMHHAKRNMDWTASLQEPSGWIPMWGLHPEWAVLHTIAYTLRGLVEGAIHFEDEKLLNAVEKGINFVCKSQPKGFPYQHLVPSHFTREGKTYPDLCVTGLSQLAIVLLKYEEATGKTDFQELAGRIINATRRFQLRGFSNPILNGVMPASIPFSGRYQSWDLIEWGTKFFLDTMLINMGISPAEIRG